MAIDDVYGTLIIDDALGAYGNEAKRASSTMQLSLGL